MRERGECSAVGTGEETEEAKRSGGYGVFGASSITCQAERTGKQMSYSGFSYV